MKDLIFHSEYNGKEICEVHSKDGVPYIEFKPFRELPFVIHGFSTRLGGVSDREFASMNLSYHRGDDSKNVDRNYELICNALNIDKEQLVFTNQIHDTKIQYADGSQKQYANTDGLITDKSGIVIATSYADCVPLYFVDVKKKVIGFSHSGWRGTVGKIGKKTVEEMSKKFNSNKEDIIAIIGPSICKDCYEVSEEVAQEFSNVLSKEQIKDVIFEKGNGKYQLDLWKANQWILLDTGLRSENIYISGLCTSCNSDVLFSHRATKGKRGNLNGFLGIR